MAVTGEQSLGRRFDPVDPESENLLALAANAARSPPDSATESLTRRVDHVPARTSRTTRSRSDLCPGALRPWLAEDGLLVRLRVIGGRVRSSQLRSLVAVAEEYGDGRVRLTSRANLQVRALPGTTALKPEVLAALVETGLVPAPTHELVRNVMISPQTGLAGGRADLTGVGRELDDLLCASRRLAHLPGRFLFVLDDGRGDLIGRDSDLSLAVLDHHRAQLRIGESWGPIVRLDHAAVELASLATRFAQVRGQAPTAPWHVRELVPTQRRELQGDPVQPDPRLPAPAPPLGFGEVPGGHHHQIDEHGLGREQIEALTADHEYVVITPWRGVLVPTSAHQRQEPS